MLHHFALGSCDEEADIPDEDLHSLFQQWVKKGIPVHAATPPLYSFRLENSVPPPSLVHEVQSRDDIGQIPIGHQDLEWLDSCMSFFKCGLRWSVKKKATRHTFRPGC